MSYICNKDKLGAELQVRYRDTLGVYDSGNWQTRTSSWTVNASGVIQIGFPINSTWQVEVTHLANAAKYGSTSYTSINDDTGTGYEYDVHVDRRDWVSNVVYNASLDVTVIVIEGS